MTGTVPIACYLSPRRRVAHSGEVAAFAIDMKIHKIIQALNGAPLLQEDLNNVASLSTSKDFIFNEGDCQV